MAVYKVIQDIESEDKLIGPLTLKGFIYAAIAGVLLFIDIRLLLSGASTLLKLLLSCAFFPPMLLFGVLASPLGREQPTEVWLLSRVRFFFKPRIRKWNQSGIKQLVMITAPKKISRSLTKNFSQADVNSRLQALANTLDSRGWVIKNVAINEAPLPLEMSDVDISDERLSSATTLSQQAPVLDVHPSDDILNTDNPAARNMDGMIEQAEFERRDQLLSRVQNSPTPTPQVINSSPTSDELALLEKVHAREADIKNHPPIIRGGAPTSPQEQTVKMELANSGNDLSVAAIASLAKNNSGSSRA